MKDRPRRARKPAQSKDYFYPKNEKRARKENVKTIRRQNSLPQSPTNPTDSDRGHSPEAQAVPIVQPTVPNRHQQNPSIQTQTVENQPLNTMTKFEILNKIYTDPQFPTAYSAEIRKFLMQKESLSRHKQKINKFPRRKVFVSGPWTLIQADTIFYRNYARQNNNYQYILAVVDCFSRKNWVRPQKTTTAEETAKNLDDIISSMPFKPTQFASGLT